MRMLATALAFTLLALGAARAQAPLPPLIQGPPETIYSDADRARDDALSRRFVQSLLKPSHSLDGQFTRWKIQVCPHVVGLSPASAYVVERRIREVAQIGAPLDRKDPCRQNIVIFVTPHPQELLDAMAQKEFLLVAGTRHKDRLEVKYPVQSWYFGMYRDYNGRVWMDMDCEFYLDECPPRVAAKGTRLTTGIKAQMIAATILVDSQAVTGMTLGTLADYLALMSLAQAPATGNCQPAPSIANLFVKECAGEMHVTDLSEADTAMLKALYQTDEEPEKLQWQRLGGNMRKNLEDGHRK